MPDERRTFIDVLNAHRGLMVLLAIGVAVLLLAVAVPQTWATPDQNRLRETIENVVPDEEPPTCYRACDQPIYVDGDGFVTGTDSINYTGAATLYLTSNVEWFSGTTSVEIGDPIVFAEVYVWILDGKFDDLEIWLPPPELAPGGYDLFVDINANGILDNGDGINNRFPGSEGDYWIGAGVCVDPCKEVGGATLARRQYWLVPGVAAVVALFLGGAVAGLAWRRRRG